MASNIDAGVGQHAVLTNPTGLAGSTTQNPLTPVQYGKNSEKSKYTTTTSDDPLVADLVVGPVATVTIDGTVSTKADGDQTGVATTGGLGYGATVTYTVASNVASGGTIVAAGADYLVGDVLTVVGDTGVTFTVATLS